MKQIRLEDVLTEDQLMETHGTIAELLADNIHPLDPKFTTRLRQLFRKWSADLGAKGVLPDYLAYAVAYSVLRTQKERRDEQRA